MILTGVSASSFVSAQSRKYLVAIGETKPRIWTAIRSTSRVDASVSPSRSAKSSSVLTSPLQKPEQLDRLRLLLGAINGEREGDGRIYLVAWCEYGLVESDRPEFAPTCSTRTSREQRQGSSGFESPWRYYVLSDAVSAAA